MPSKPLTPCKHPGFPELTHLLFCERHRHQLICGDSTEAAVYELLMDGQKANLIVTDPPYGTAYEVKAGNIKPDKEKSTEKMRICC